MAFLLLSSLTYAHTTNDGWSHIALKSHQNVDINLDYKTTEYRYYNSVVTNLKDLWVHVKRAGLTSSDKIRIVFINYPFHRPNDPEVETFDLKYSEDGRYILNLASFGFNIFNARQELALVINGEWQRPQLQSDKQNFEFQLIPFIEK